ncbi:MAG: peptidoglycan-associated lipoprotein Pal [Granulosicoccaceae bacterium]
MNSMMKAGIAIAMTAVMAGCETMGLGEEGAEVSVEDRSTQAGAEGAAAAEGAQAAGALAGTAFQGHALDDPNSLLSKRVIYFDFDSSTIRDEYREIIRVHAGYLSSNPNAVVVLEGHTDERGSREYNIALGERRAKAVRQLLLFQGATAKQQETVSYGEERPINPEHYEAAWQQNRRVEIVYKVR